MNAFRSATGSRATCRYSLAARREVRRAAVLLRPAPVRQRAASIGGEHHGQQQPCQPREYGGVPEPRKIAFAHDVGGVPLRTTIAQRSRAAAAFPYRPTINFARRDIGGAWALTIKSRPRDAEGRYLLLGGAFSRLLTCPLAKVLGFVTGNDIDTRMLAA